MDRLGIMQCQRWLVITATWIVGACSTAPDAAATVSAIDRYRASFRQAAGSRFVGSCDRDELALQLQSARVLWLGDHHKSTRVHALHTELLQDLLRRGRRLALVLEAIGTADAPAVQRYLAGAMTQDELRLAMRQRWPGSWLDDEELDPWYYRSLLDLARGRGMPVLALEPAPRLRLAERDDRMAARVRDAARELPDHLLVVIVGQAHLLGEGNLIARTGLPSVAIGAEPTPTLRAAAVPAAERGSLLRSDSGLLWFREVLATGTPSTFLQPGPAPAGAPAATLPRISSAATR